MTLEDRTIATVAERFTGLAAGDDAAFEALARSVYAYQCLHNSIYARYCISKKWEGWENAAYLPVEAFKLAPVTTFPPEEANAVFESSGTRRGTPSRHYVRDLAVYERSVRRHFEAVFGNGPFTLVAHLPHYVAHGSRSSLLYMVDLLVRHYGDAHSGFFLEDRGLLERAVAHSEAEGTPLLLFGAAFGLLDLIDEAPVQLPTSARVIETGGMKTFRRAVQRADLHRRLAEGLGVPEAQIWSEYGMCELMSQAYTRGGAVFFPPPWMRFRIVDPELPTRTMPEGRPGVLALFDLANLYSVAPILTEDRAVQRGAGFEILGRLSQAELRGCNFLVEGQSSKSKSR